MGDVGGMLSADYVLITRVNGSIIDTYNLDKSDRRLDLSLIFAPRLLFFSIILTFCSHIYAVGDGLPDNVNGYGLASMSTSMLIIGTLYPFYETTAIPIDLTNELTWQLSREHRELLVAKDDALTYIATNGDYKTARLEKAVQILRKRYPHYYTDMGLVKTVSTYR